MKKKEELIGCLYPVTNIDNKIFGYKRITQIYDCSSHAGYFILLNNNKNCGLLIGYKQGWELSKDKEQSDKSNNLESSEAQIITEDSDGYIVE